MANYIVNIPEFHGRVSLQSAGFFSGPKLLVDGAAAPAGDVRGTYRVPTPTGDENVKLVFNGFRATLPAIEFRGAKVPMGELLPTWLTALTFLPLVILPLGGAIGGIFGGVGIALNQSIGRSDLSLPMKVLAMLGIAGVSTIAWLTVATIFHLAVRR